MIISLENKPLITCPGDVFAILKEVLASESAADQDKEHFRVFYMDARNQVKDLELISMGTLDTTTVHPREVFTNAIACRCKTIIVAHNHPSGVVTPSEADITMTTRLIKASALLDIPLVDHLVISTTEFVSMKSLGYI